MEDNNNWVCPRCGDIIEITEEGIYHASNKKGPHFQRYTIEDLDAIKRLERKQLNEMYYGRRWKKI